MANCPACRSTISAVANVCPYCRTELIRVAEKGIMYDEKVPAKLKNIFRFAPLASSIAVILYCNGYTKRGIIYAPTDLQIFTS